MKIKGNENIYANGDVNIYQKAVENIEEEFGVINNIFTYVTERLKSKNFDKTQKLSREKLLHLNKKIILNFQNNEDIKEVKEYFTTLFSKINAVEKSFQSLDENEQQDVHFYISSKYHDLKRTEENKIVILKKLSNFFIPPNQLHNPTYVSVAQSIILFFFDDCTIFEKTKQENDNQTSLFDDIK